MGAVLIVIWFVVSPGSYERAKNPQISMQNFKSMKACQKAAKLIEKSPSVYATATCIEDE